MRRSRSARTWRRQPPCFASLTFVDRNVASHGGQRPEGYVTLGFCQAEALGTRAISRRDRKDAPSIGRNSRGQSPIIRCEIAPAGVPRRIGLAYHRMCEERLAKPKHQFCVGCLASRSANARRLVQPRGPAFVPKGTSARRRVESDELLPAETRQRVSWLAKPKHPLCVDWCGREDSNLHGLPR